MESVVDSKQTIMMCTIIMRDMLEDVLTFIDVPEKKEMLEINKMLGECLLKAGADKKTVDETIKKSAERL